MQPAFKCIIKTSHMARINAGIYHGENTKDLIPRTALELTGIGNYIVIHEIH